MSRAGLCLVASPSFPALINVPTPFFQSSSYVMSSSPSSTCGRISGDTESSFMSKSSEGSPVALMAVGGCASNCSASSPQGFVSPGTIEPPTPFREEVSVREWQVGGSSTEPWQHFLEDGGAESLLAAGRGLNSCDILWDFPFSDERLREKLYARAFDARIFYRLCEHEIGNVVIKRLIEEARDAERKMIVALLSSRVCELARGYFSWRVVQKALRHIDTSNRAILTLEIVGAEHSLAVHSSSSLLLQTIFELLPPTRVRFIINAFTSSQQVLHSVVTDKYGCRVIESALKTLAAHRTHGSRMAKTLLKELGDALVEGAGEYISDQFGNFVMQTLLTADQFTDVAAIIIERFVLGNVLLYSQEKHSSHVMEAVFRNAPPAQLAQLMDEVFFGYEPDTYGRDALEVILFDKYGNYVVQAMIDAATAVREGVRGGDRTWFTYLAHRVIRRQRRLLLFSSGKTIINKLREIGQTRLASCSPSSSSSEVDTLKSGDSVGSMVPSASIVPLKFR